MAHPIDHDKILENIEMMVNLLEYDSQRSSGKMKLNSQHLHSLLWLKDHYESKVKNCLLYTSPSPRDS